MAENIQEAFSDILYENTYPNLQVRYLSDDFADLWSILLAHLHGTNYYKDDSGDGLFPTLAGLIDFSDEAFPSFINSLIDSYSDNNWLYTNNTFWNETWAAALEHFIKSIYDDDDYENSLDIYVDEEGNIIDLNCVRGGITVHNGISFRYKDILRADAGANFCSLDEIGTKAAYYANGTITLNNGIKEIILDATFIIDGEIKLSNIKVLKVNDKESYNTYIEFTKAYPLAKIEISGVAQQCYRLIKPWVIPWYNVNGYSYSTVRGNDKKISVLSDSSDLSFTKGQDENGRAYGIRLLMPKNRRYVEVEDLNRNFWVIAQVISAISIFLFDEDGPVAGSFKDLIGAIADLWENVEYLWAAILAYGQKPYTTKIVNMVIPLTNSDLQPYVKFDNFDISLVDLNTTRAACEERLAYLKDSYLGCNLVVLPEIRLNNYEKNYYAQVYYPGVMIINRNTDTVSWDSYAAGWTIDLTNSTYWSDLYTLREQDEENYAYFAPATEPITDDNAKRYYMLLRPEYNIVYTYDEENESINRDTDNTYIAYYDLAREIITGEKYEVWRNNIGTWSSINTDNGTLEINKGYYQGEVLSYFKKSNELVWDIGARNYQLLPYDTVNFSDVEADKDNIQNNDSEPILSRIVGVMANGGSQSLGIPSLNRKSFYLITGSHLYNADIQESATTGYEEHPYYWIDPNQDMLTKPIVYCKIRNSVNASAAMWNPKTESIEEYKDYWTYTNFMPFGVYLINAKKVDIYLKKGSNGKVRDDNWLIKVSEVVASTVKNGDFVLPTNINDVQYDYDYTPGGQLYSDKMINERIFISYFLPNNVMQTCYSQREPMDGVQDWSTTAIGNFSSWRGTWPNLEGYDLFKTTLRESIWDRQINGKWADYEYHRTDGFNKNI